MKERPAPHAMFSTQNDRCVLCSVEVDVSSCRKCMLGWREIYAKRMADKRSPLVYTRAEERKVVCVMCIIEREYGLNIEDLLTEDEKANVSFADHMLSVHGPPSLVFMRTSFAIGHGSQSSEPKTTTAVQNSNEELETPEETPSMKRQPRDSVHS